MSEQDLQLVVTGRRAVADGVVELELAREDGGGLPAWAPGSHLEIDLADGLVRHYSLCGSREDVQSYRIAVLLAEAGRGGSRHVHETLEVGSHLSARGPRDRFRLEPAKAYVFIAGGVGITPLIPMIDEVDSADIPWHLVYGGRTVSSMAYVDELSRRYGDKVEVRPQDTVGLIDFDEALAGADADTAVYCCGPEALLAAVEERASVTSWPLHVERFVAGEAVDESANDEIEVVLADSGKTISVAPTESILEAVEKAGVFVLSSCREGICGTCETPVLSGEIDHRDSYLTDDERAAGDVMMICVSRAKSASLELEL